jgi:hypothetical protein
MVGIAHRFDSILDKMAGFFNPNIKKTTFRAGETRGLVVRQKTHDQEVLDSIPLLWRPFFRQHSFGSKRGTKTVENSNLALLHVL